MSEDAKIKQVASIGSNGTQIGIMNNQFGLSPKEAVDLAMQIFREFYPQMKSQILEEINQTVFDKLKNEPIEQIVSPNPRIALPTIQNACITPEKDIRELYEELLANSMKDSVKNGVHPGFVEIIKQLCPDEAKILQYLKARNTIPIITVRYELKKGGGVDLFSNFSNIGEMVDCEYPLKISEYFDNLNRLGIINNHGELASLIDKSLYEPLKRHPYIMQLIEEPHIKAAGFEKSRIQESFINLTSFGIAFCKACIVDAPLHFKQPTYQ